MRRASILTLLFSRILSASDARFTDELWVPVEPLYQRMLASHANAGKGQRELLNRAVREALEALAQKAPDTEWQTFLFRDAAQIAETPRNTDRMTRATEDYASLLNSTAKKRSFGEGLAGVLAEYWINFEFHKDRGESMSREFIETMAQLTRMMNSAAARMDDAGRKRLKEVFAQAARAKLAFEKQ